MICWLDSGGHRSRLMRGRGIGLPYIDVSGLEIVRSRAHKELLLRNSGDPWTPESTVRQCPGSDLPGQNSFGVVLDALQAQIKRRAPLDVESKTVLLDGRHIHLQFIVMRASRNGKKMMVERRPVQQKISSDVISNAIKRLFVRTQLPEFWKPRMLRHYFATVMQNGMVARGRWSQQQLVDVLRHKDAETTKKAYIAASLHPATEARWAAAGDLLMTLHSWALFWQ